ncbi:hypothetical protein BKA62DRAFT_273641 [Auriculariales sp. MPI-PUGE-AT-0066]|nr:hypothetical protein BKA62DRAFT_273641 [Auriculariales sp. MPI-PUGE-AT-0066]
MPVVSTTPGGAATAIDTTSTPTASPELPASTSVSSVRETSSTSSNSDIQATIQTSDANNSPSTFHSFETATTSPRQHSSSRHLGDVLPGLAALETQLLGTTTTDEHNDYVSTLETTTTSESEPTETPVWIMPSRPTIKPPASSSKEGMSPFIIVALVCVSVACATALLRYAISYCRRRSSKKNPTFRLSTHENNHEHHFVDIEAVNKFRDSVSSHGSDITRQLVARPDGARHVGAILPSVALEKECEAWRERVARPTTPESVCIRRGDEQGDLLQHALTLAGPSPYDVAAIAPQYCQYLQYSTLASARQPQHR